MGLLHLAAIFYFPSSTYRSKQWRTRFLQLRIHPDHCPQLSLLRQALLQFPRHTTMLPPTWPLLCGLHRNRHASPATQPQSQIKATSQEHPHFSRTLPSLLACNQPSPSSPPSTLLHTRIMTKRGFTNACTSPDGNLHSIGPTSHST